MRSTARSGRVNVWVAALEGGRLVAGAQLGGGWATHDVRPSLAGVDEALRIKLAQQWTHVGLSTHASVASYARFALQLLALGAPPELVSRTQSAMVDKTRHARLAFALASHYEGRSVGPGKLRLDRELDAEDVESLVMTLVVGGCFGESVASSEAKASLDHVTDPVLRFALGEIARDGSEHALLAWRSLIWLCDMFAERVTPVVEEAISQLRSALADRPRIVATAADEALLFSGYLGAAVCENLRRVVLERVVLGGLDALVTGASAPSSVDGGRLTLV